MHLINSLRVMVFNIAHVYGEDDVLEALVRELLSEVNLSEGLKHPSHSHAFNRNQEEKGLARFEAVTNGHIIRPLLPLSLTTVIKV